MGQIKEKKNLFYILTGTILEHADSMLFALYLPLIATHFLGAKTQDAMWYLGFLSFSLYFVVRPIGALVLVIIGDTYGRKTALILSISLMSIATLGMGLSPAYSEYGIAIIVIFLCFRILQGFSVGGEYSTAMTYVFETTPPHRQLLNGALLISASHLGGTVASICAYTSPTQFQQIFVAAGLVGLLSLRGRSGLTETHNTKSLDLNSEIKKVVICNYFRIIAASSSLIFIFYTTVVYFNKIISQKYHVDMKAIFAINLLLHLLWVVLSPIVGLIGDRYALQASTIMRTGACGVIFIGVPCLIKAFQSDNVVIFLVAQIVISFFHIIFCMPTPKMICEFFSINNRNTHVALSYAVGISATAALMPIINDFAFKKSGIYGLGAVLILFAAIGLSSTIKRGEYD